MADNEKLTKEKIKSLEQKILNEFLENIFAFSYNKTGSHTEAEDLSQDILLAIFSALYKVKSIRNFNAWVWRIARNTYCSWGNQKLKEKENFVYCDFEFFKGLDQTFKNENEMINLVHREISYLSKNHRTVIISYYLKRLNCQDIAEELNTPVGTIKRMLFEARNNIKKGINEMCEYNEISHSPKTLMVRTGDSHGKTNNPKENINRYKIVQTILLEAYEKPISTEELSKTTGIPCVYIEDGISNLIELGVIRKCCKNTFQTNFIIRTGALKRELITFMKEEVKNFVQEYDKIIEDIKKNYIEGNLNSQNYPWDQFLWIVLYRLYALSYRNSVMSSPIDSFQPYGFILEDYYSEDERIAWGWYNKPRGVILPKNDGDIGFVGYSTYWNLGQKLLVNNRPALYSNEVSICQKVFSQKFDLKDASEDEKTCLAELIQEGVIENNNGIMSLKVLAFTQKQHNQLDLLIKEKFSGAIKAYESTMKDGIALVKKHAPNAPEEENIRNFVLSGQGVGGIVGLIYNEYVKRKSLCKIKPDVSFSPTCYLILN